jgi:HTH-type transcriptional regulator/antitoxin HipB
MPLTVRIRALRERRGWSQAELGRRAGVAASTINRVERGETTTLSLGNLERLARALGVSPRSLLATTKR